MNKYTDPVTNSIDSAKEEWESETFEEMIEFESFKGKPQVIRRHNLINGGMAVLHFGKDVVKNKWIDAIDTIYLGFITSDVAGDGARLLSRIKALADKYDLLIKGKAQPLKPINWPVNRPYCRNSNCLEAWYLKNGFEILGKDDHTIQYPPSTKQNLKSGD